jgi:hypothetical protein
VAVALHWPAEAGTTMLPGHVTVGGCVSMTVTVKEQPAVFPTASATLQVTVVLPTAKVEPDAGEHTGVPTPAQLSATAGDP